MSINQFLGFTVNLMNQTTSFASDQLRRQAKLSVADLPSVQRGF
jgi:hypothetical protein